jgi:hypothetical protein
MRTSKGFVISALAATALAAAGCERPRDDGSEIGQDDVDHAGEMKPTYREGAGKPEGETTPGYQTSPEQDDVGEEAGAAGQAVPGAGGTGSTGATGSTGTTGTTGSSGTGTTGTTGATGTTGGTGSSGTGSDLGTVDDAIGRDPTSARDWNGDGLIDDQDFPAAVDWNGDGTIDALDVPPAADPAGPTGSADTTRRRAR